MSDERTSGQRELLERLVSLGATGQQWFRPMDIAKNCTQALHRLERRGLVESRGRITGSGRKVYRITATGRRYAKGEDQ